MNIDGKTASYSTDPNQLPEYFPTHLLDSSFWVCLGRAVATFGFLEETLGKAIFALTATKEIAEEDFEDEYENCFKTLNWVLTDPLGSLTDLYAKAVREHQKAYKEDLGHLVEQLRIAANTRNALCHGSWRPPKFGGEIATLVRYEERPSV